MLVIGMGSLQLSVVGPVRNCAKHVTRTRTDRLRIPCIRVIDAALSPASYLRSWRPLLPRPVLPCPLGVPQCESSAPTSLTARRPLPFSLPPHSEGALALPILPRIYMHTCIPPIRLP